MINEEMAAVRTHLGHAAGLAAKTEAAERRILAAAENRLEKVEVEIQRLRPTAITVGADGERYQEMVQERGALNQVIAKARVNLGM